MTIDEIITIILERQRAADDAAFAAGEQLGAVLIDPAEFLSADNLAVYLAHCGK